MAANCLSSFYVYKEAKNSPLDDSSFSSTVSLLSASPNPRQLSPHLFLLRFRTFNTFTCLSSSSFNDPTVTSEAEANGGLRILFAGGGTGSHIYPAVAIADEIKISHPTAQILFLGSPNSIESKAIPAAGYEFRPTPAVRLARPFFSPQNILLPYHLIKTLIACYYLLLDFGPNIVVGTGGMVSFPVCLAATLMSNINSVIHEQNSVPGIANWILSHFVDLVFVAFDSTIDHFPRKDKCLVSGNPVRLTLLQYTSKAVSRFHFFPKSSKAKRLEVKVLLILGGSLGANGLNIAMLSLYHRLLVEDKNLFIIWQTGVRSFDEMESLVKDHPRLHLTSFMHSMDMAYAAADLVISRAGAMTCSEILATGKPSILVPSPNDAEGYQMRNALEMEELASSKVISEDELNGTTLQTAIMEILGDETKMAEMSERALKVAKPNASAEIVQHIISLINLSNTKEISKTRRKQ